MSREEKLMLIEQVPVKPAVLLMNPDQAVLEGRERKTPWFLELALWCGFDLTQVVHLLQRGPRGILLAPCWELRHDRAVKRLGLQRL